MLYGATIFPTSYAMHPAELGPALEERGFESLWVAEHSHIPLPRVSAWPGGDDLPQMYYDTLDPFVALTAAAATTTTLKLATGIALVAQRDPIHTAKQAASLDVLSNGRFMLGVGAGWNYEEMSDHGTDPERRFGRMRESVEAMRAIWGNEVAEYHGEQIDFGPMHCNPKPLNGNIAVHVGGVYPGAMRRAVSYGDGWLPIGARGADDLQAALQSVDELCDQAGRPRSSFEVSVYGPSTDREALDQLADMGVDRVAFFLPPAPANELIPKLDELAGLITA